MQTKLITKQKNYNINYTNLILNDDDRTSNLKFHVKSNDYFGTLATMISLVLQQKIKMEEGQNILLNNLKNDLLYLQENYKIVKKK